MAFRRRSCIEQGQLGRVYYYESHYDRFRPQIKPGWRENPLPGSGILYDLGSHLIDQALLLFGLPQSVTADVITQRSEGKVDDYFHLILAYGRTRVILHSANLVRAAGPRLTAKTVCSSSGNSPHPQIALTKHVLL